MSDSTLSIVIAALVAMYIARASGFKYTTGY